MICQATNCQTCASEQPYQCQTCNSGYTADSNHVCHINCQVTGCLHCSAPNVCDSCEASFALQNNTCQPTRLIEKLKNCSFLSDQSSNNICRDIMNTPGVEETLIFNQLLSSFPSLAYLLGWTVPFLSFNRDYMYYLYHDGNLTGHPISITFFEVITQLNNQQSLPLIG